MEYLGKLYGKVGKTYFPLNMTAEDVDELVKFKESVIAEINARKVNTKQSTLCISCNKHHQSVKGELWCDKCIEEKIK
jgi:hypothetical protein